MAWLDRIKERFHRTPSEAEEAFPGDTYLADLKKAYRVGKPWAKWLRIAVGLGAIADFYFMFTTVAIAFDAGEWTFEWVLNLFVAFALVALYIFVGYILGKKLRDFKAFRSWSSLFAVLIALLVVLVALWALTVFRLSAEDGDLTVLRTILSFGWILGYQAYNDPVHMVFVMTLIMLLSAFISSVYAYYSGDAVAEVVYRESAVSLPTDRAYYRRVFSQHANDSERERSYEQQACELDEEAVKSAFRLGSIASQLNGMVDPADAQEFLNAQRVATDSYFHEGEE